MNPVNFPEANMVLTAPEGMVNCQPLPVLRQAGHVLSVWELSDAEAKEVFVSRRVILQAVGDTHPPVSLRVVGMK